MLSVTFKITFQFVHVCKVTKAMLSQYAGPSQWRLRDLNQKIFAIPRLVEKMRNATMDNVHVSLNIMAIHTLDVDQSALLTMTVLGTKLAYVTNVSTLAQGHVAKMPGVKSSITYQHVLVLIVWLEMHSTDAHPGKKIQ